MSKKTIISTLVVLLISLTAAAQQYDVLDQVRADRRKAAGMEGPHRFDAPALTKAPRGYKPFYISHYGRHGSRYGWSSKSYIYLRDILTKAHEDQALTELGEEFYRNYMDFYEKPFISAGDLLPLGFEEQKLIGEWTYDSFPEVFGKDNRVDAIVSVTPRSIVSMSSFCLSLQKKNPRLDIFQSSNHANLVVITPTKAPNQLLRKFKEDDISGVESSSDFRHRFLDYDGLLSRIFKSPDYPEKFSGGRSRFLKQCFLLVNGYHNYEDRPLFDNIFTADQMVMMWEAENYASFYGDLNGRYGNIPLLEDIIDRAEKAFLNPSQAADLRFGHDYVLEAFMCLINANGCGTVPERASEVKYWFQSYNIPMAATVMFVFYRNKKGDILFKLIWNEAEATLPQLTPVSGPYYKWADFIAWAQEMMTAHPELPAAD